MHTYLPFISIFVHFSSTVCKILLCCMDLMFPLFCPASVFPLRTQLNFICIVSEHITLFCISHVKWQNKKLVLLFLIPKLCKWDSYKKRKCLILYLLVIPFSSLYLLVFSFFLYFFTLVLNLLWCDIDSIYPLLLSCLSFSHKNLTKLYISGYGTHYVGSK